MKKICVLILTIFCFTMLYACSAAPKESAQSQTEQDVSLNAPPAKDITQKNDSLTIWFFESPMADAMKQSLIYKEAVDMFAAKYPNLSVVLDTVYTNDEAALNRANIEIMAGNGPDVFFTFNGF